jgi:hypothetical protein
MKLLLGFLLSSILLLGQVQVDVQTPSAPQFGPQTIHKAKLSWTASDQKVNYRVWRSAKEAGPYAAIADSIVVLTYTDLSVISGKTYYYKVDCRNPKTNLISKYSNIVEAVIP